PRRRRRAPGARARARGRGWRRPRSAAAGRRRRRERGRGARQRARGLRLYAARIRWVDRAPAMVEVALARSGRAVTLEFVRRAEDLAAALEACSAIDRSFALDDLFDGALGEGEEGTPVMPGLR